MVNNEKVVNTLYFRQTTGSITFTTLGELTGLIQSWWNTSYKLVQSDDYLLERIVGKDLTTELGFESLRTVNEVGNVPGNLLPNNVTFAVKFTTGRLGRSTRGRNYIPAIRESEVTFNTLSVSQASAYVGAYQQLLPTLVGATSSWEWVVVSRKQNGVVLPAGITYDIGTVSTTNLTVDTQRRRLPKN